MTRITPHLVILILQQCEKQVLKSLSITSNGLTRIGIRLENMPQSIEISGRPQFSEAIPKHQRKYCKGVQKRYEKLTKSIKGIKKLQEVKERNLQPPTLIERYRSKTGRPLLLGKLDSIVQKYIGGMSNRIAFPSPMPPPKALIRKYPNVVGDIDLDSSYWAHSFFRRMEFLRRRKTYTKVDLPESAQK